MINSGSPIAKMLKQLATKRKTPPEILLSELLQQEYRKTFKKDFLYK
jgi:hypothetical protein